ncbi:cysteine-rich CWC family protein [Burkholderia glumae]|uniref:cysteine-rich CWC family protein n=1 Tax=Burkholderia glumae TaxID=337 RepID=UPI001373BCEC|nr:cysteine-rich CWC family protein [Burkholderia glumae]QHP91242.1 hypothetical protein EXE55_10025 [Burkholderia glumae]QJP73051.1 hypothetical protein HJC54_23605 [Burkholderia glumae]
MAPISPAATAVPASRRCPRCRRASGCGAPAPDAPGARAAPLRCWCAALPPLPAGPDGAPLAADRCLCPDCYARALAGQPAGRRVTPTE